MNLNFGSQKLQIKLIDIAVSILILISATSMFYYLSGKYSQDQFTHEAQNIWFQSDTNSVYETISNRLTLGISKTSEHPLIGFEQYPLNLTLKALGVSNHKAIRLSTAIISALVILSLYILLKLIGCLTIDALLFSILGYFSASTFFLTVPETYALGALTIIYCLCLTTIASQYKVPNWAFAFISALTLSVSFTNWLVGLLSTFTSMKFVRSCLISLTAIILISLLWFLEKYFFPNTLFFLDRFGEDSSFIFWPSIERFSQVAFVFFFHTIVMPAVSIIGDNNFGWTAISIQTSIPTSGSVLSILGTVIWSSLLLMGLWALFKLKNLLPLRITLGFSIIGQIIVHTLYSKETFIYSLHFLPLLLCLAALSTLTPLRRYALPLVVLLIPIIGLNNLEQFKFVSSVTSSPNQIFKNAMQARPHDPWPRGQGHIVLATPGTKELNKAYLEPGGSFSPRVGSFGLSIWLENKEGKLQLTSDSINFNGIKQSLDWSRAKQIPDVQTQTKYYNQAWMQKEQDKWHMSLDFTNKEYKPFLLVRSVGPAGGQIRTITWDGKALLLNKRWLVTLDVKPEKVYLGEETVPGWKKTNSQLHHINSPLGWAFARIEVDPNKKVQMNIQDLTPPKTIDLYSESTLADLKINLPDSRFSDSLNAQVCHMMMGIVDLEIRPADPVMYPLPWQRDGAYILVALARSGKLETAKTLSNFIAENDFFGGFGPESDAPGLSIWALTDVSMKLMNKDYDKWLWPHIKRKAEFIERMLVTKTKIEMPITQPLLSNSINDKENKLVAWPATNGLINGRMDHHQPVLFINAVSYQGLVEASLFAIRLGHFDEANRWKQKANKLKSAWNNAFQAPMSDNERTYISALWPTWVATEKSNQFTVKLNQRWEYLHDDMNQFKNKPIWTYFDLAEAHQWLFLDRPDRTWNTLEWFWNHQSSPGLFTWSEGVATNQGIEKWTSVRGSIIPPDDLLKFPTPSITPHYWSAAEMSLMQLDMLAYINKFESEPVLVVGAGIPKNWMTHEMSVEGLRVGNMHVDWNWSDNKMNITVHGSKDIKVKLGKNFPPSTNIELHFKS